jgi:hypothetical protein
MKTRRFFYYGKFAVFGIAGLIAFTFAVMWLWNWLVPGLFNGPELGYWQTLGLLVLSKILFSGIGKGQHSNHDWRDRHGYDCCEHDGHPWGDREKWRKKYEACMNGKMEQGAGTEQPG